MLALGQAKTQRSVTQPEMMRFLPFPHFRVLGSPRCWQGSGDQIDGLIPGHAENAYVVKEEPVCNFSHWVGRTRRGRSGR